MTETTQFEKEEEVRQKIQAAEKKLNDAKELQKDAAKDVQVAHGELHVLKRMLSDKRSETEKNKAYLDRQKEINEERWKLQQARRQIVVDSGLMTAQEAAQTFKVESCAADRKLKQGVTERQQRKAK
jgi:dsDNA-specific endonuclease/ATPase MutS2